MKQQNGAANEEIPTAPDSAYRPDRRRPRVYCTYFDQKYIHRGLALWRSLRHVSADALLWICCLDDETHRFMNRLALPGVHLFSLAQLERHFPDLAAVKATRSHVEYYFTCTPSVVRFVLDVAPDVPQVTYLDADLYFFADPEPLFQELESADGAVGIIAHRFPAELKDREVYGIYNVGWLTFCRDARGMACLEHWRRNCVDWCYVQPKDGKFADQKYLDDWPGRFAGVVVLQHKGANVALWNVNGARVRKAGRHVAIDDEPLLFYHFHGLAALSSWLFRVAANEYGVELSLAMRRWIYRPYLCDWREMAALVAVIGRGDAGRIRGAAVRHLARLLRDRLRGMSGTGGEYLTLLSPWAHLRAYWRAAHSELRVNAARRNPR